jgi:putative ABC transport system substrate-binding protein
MRRREFLAALGAAPLFGPRAARAQRPAAVPAIGYLDSSGLPQWYDAFRRGLSDLGYTEGKSIALEYRSAEGHAERLPSLAAELVNLGPKLIVASGSPATVAAKGATATIPVVFTYATDPVGVGIIASLARPGGNVNRTVEPGARPRWQETATPRGNRTGRLQIRCRLDSVLHGQSCRLRRDAAGRS